MGVAPTSPQYDHVRVTRVPDDSTPDAASAEDELSEDELRDRVADAQEAIEDVNQRLAEVPAEVVVTNHVMGLYQLAAIHLSATPPNLPSAALAIDAVACLVDGLGDRLGEHTTTMRDALANIRIAFVQVKAASAASDDHDDDAPQRDGEPADS